MVSVSISGSAYIWTLNYIRPGYMDDCIGLKTSMWQSPLKVYLNFYEKLNSPFECDTNLMFEFLSRIVLTCAACSQLLDHNVHSQGKVY